jgi:hypothetical protein
MDERIARRTLLIAAAAGSLLPAITNERVLAANAPLESTLTPATPIPLTPTQAVSADVQVKNWMALLTRLSDHGVWPKTFDNPYEVGIKDKLKTIAEQEAKALTHNARLVEPLLGEISSLVDRCLSYRREGDSLAIQGVAAAIQRLQSDTFMELDRELVDADSAADVADVLATNYPAAVKYFTQIGNAEGNGQAAQLTAQVLGNTRLRDVERARVNLSLSRLEFRQELQQQLEGRYDVPGNAHNFAQRFDRTRELFDSDITSAYCRAISAAAGLKAIFGYVDQDFVDNSQPQKPAIPHPEKDDDFLDHFIIWTRKAMRAVAQIGESEIEFTRNIVVPLDPSSIATLDLTSAFSGLRYVRLRSVAVGFIAENEDATAPEKSNASFALVMVRNDVSVGPNQVVIVPNIQCYNVGRQLPNVQGSALYNVDPQTKWTVRLSSTGLTSTQKPINRQGWITGLLFQLSVVGVVDPKVGNDWWLSADRV